MQQPAGGQKLGVLGREFKTELTIDYVITCYIIVYHMICHYIILCFIILHHPPGVLSNVFFSGGSAGDGFETH